MSQPCDVKSSTRTILWAEEAERLWPKAGADVTRMIARKPKMADRSRFKGIRLMLRQVFVAFRSAREGRGIAPKFGSRMRNSRTVCEGDLFDSTGKIVRMYMSHIRKCRQYELASQELALESARTYVTRRTKCDQIGSNQGGVS